MQIGPIHAVVLAAATMLCLGGCAGIEADVHASGGVATQPAALPGALTYRMARTQPQQGAADHPRYEAQLRDELAHYGLTDDESDAAHYVLSVAYATRPAEVDVKTGECVSTDVNAGAAAGSNAACDAQQQAAPGFAWFGRRAYRHALSLRFFDSADGKEVYKVSAVTDDHDPDPAHALPTLVKSALARFPFDGEGHWRVKLRNDGNTQSPAVVSVTPAAPR